MQPDTPYQLIELLGSCQVGTVWSAVDIQARPLTVAVLTAAAGVDQRWREAFTAAANSLRQTPPGAMGYLYADFTAATPWIACGAEAGGLGAERVFLALGQDYHPVPPDFSGASEAASIGSDRAGLTPSQPVTNGTGTVPAGPGDDEVARQPMETAPPMSPFADEAQESARPWASTPSPSAVSAPPAPEPTSTPAGLLSPVLPVSAQPVSSEPVSTQPLSAQPFSAQPLSAQPLSSQPVPVQPVSAQPTSGLPISGPPTSPLPFSPLPFSPLPTSSQPYSAPPISPQPVSPQLGPYPPGGGLDPLYSPERRIQPVPRRRRAGRMVMIGVLVLAVLAGGAGAIAWRWSAGASSPSAVPTPTATLAPPPTAAPSQPGVEPPRAGAWPAAWPRFAPTDRVRTLTGLSGLGFTLKIPLTWDCVPGGRGRGFAGYRCGEATGDTPRVGGELIVRECPDQCAGAQQNAMRRAEEAWGLQWIRTGPMATYAESSSLDIDGARQYGLVVVAYWRSGGDGAVDRQLVLRMTAPVDRAGLLRRVANYIRDTVVF